MPQLDALSFSTQFIWMLIVFTGLYLYNKQWLIPKIEEIIKTRNTKIKEIKGSNDPIKKVDYKLELSTKDIKVKRKAITTKRNKINKLYLKDVVKKLIKLNI